MTHSSSECNNAYTYKSNSAKYTAIVSKRLELEKGETVYDATVKALSESGVSYTDRNGYISKIGDLSEFDHGRNSGWMFMVNGNHQNVGCKNVTLSEDATVLWFYTDDYTRERGSEKYMKPSDEQKQEENAETIEETIEAAGSFEKRKFEDTTFSDIKETDWHFEAVKFVYENNLMSGTEKGFEPDAKMTRAMLVSVLFRLSGDKKTDADVAFSDVPDGKWYTDAILWAASAGIVRGVGDNNFAPDSEVTREQMALILYNFARYKNQINESLENEKITEFEDFGEVSEYAKDAILWANSEGFISGESNAHLNPKSSATRAQTASLLMRYCEANAK